ncbi:MAG: DUF3429 domain-containing protein [Polaromonas sp.]|uniref:DUF3429 domain-containing protein n=1 Tax=Polaromonas sp. TaxID=1869339 RepID=UPI002487B184|nr:DUF3429 domain-containing protein [Polaromonas sp.]MDI1238735.1 DUF3429 domain-containing protein [Polaromonas sp.]
MTIPTPLPTLAAPDTVARALGLAGLLPFLAGAGMLWWGDPGWRPLAGTALVAYAALIASFLGGIHWGLAMRGSPLRSRHLVWGVLPSLAGWAGLLLAPDAGLALLAGLIAACLAVDCWLYPAAGAAAWLGLRLQLSAVALPCCLAGALALRAG